MRHAIVAGVGLVAGGWLAQAWLRPAQVRAIEITEVKGAGPAFVGLRWAYSPGLRPISLIIDLVGPNALSGSLTVSGQAISGAIPIATASAGPYQMSASASYRIVGLMRIHTQQFVLQASRV